MAWKVEWSPDASRFLSRLQKSEIRRIFKKLEESAENPHHYFSRLVGREDYKLRIGNYRLIALLLHSTGTIFIERIGHRKNIYQRP